MYTFQSRAAADLLMLEATAKYILQLLDKTPGEPGIITVAQIPAALETLAKAVEADEARRKALELAAQILELGLSGCAFLGGKSGRGLHREGADRDEQKECAAHAYSNETSELPVISAGLGRPIIASSDGAMSFSAPVPEAASFALRPT